MCEKSLKYRGVEKIFTRIHLYLTIGRTVATDCYTSRRIPGGQPGHVPQSPGRGIMSLAPPKLPKSFYFFIFICFESEFGSIHKKLWDKSVEFSVLGVP